MISRAMEKSDESARKDLLAMLFLSTSRGQEIAQRQAKMLGEYETLGDRTDFPADSAVKLIYDNFGLDKGATQEQSITMAVKVNPHTPANNTSWDLTANCCCGGVAQQHAAVAKSANLSESAFFAVLKSWSNLPR
jgi:hypothetical protein